MTKYHVSEDGKARICKAQTPESCKATSTSVKEHFDNPEEAQKAYENANIENTLTHFSKSEQDYNIMRRKAFLADNWSVSIQNELLPDLKKNSSNLKKLEKANQVKQHKVGALYTRLYSLINQADEASKDSLLDSHNKAGIKTFSKTIANIELQFLARSLKKTQPTIADFGNKAELKNKIKNDAIESFNQTFNNSNESAKKAINESAHQIIEKNPALKELLKNNNLKIIQ